jgi:hypothetical protein
MAVDIRRGKTICGERGTSHQESPPLNARATQAMWLILFAGCLSLGLSFTISSRSLWTDEAFSAYIACHQGLSSFWSTLSTGDSSDLQMAGYYIYLHWWVKLFGYSEYALRAANIPFICVFAIILVTISIRVFGSRWAWALSALPPFLWEQASNARAYFTVVALITVSVGSLLAYLRDNWPSARNRYPWVILGTLFIASLFHMLACLAGLPMLTILLIQQRYRPIARLSDWAPALKGMALPYLLLGLYFGWTFARGTGYSYLTPSVMSTASLIYRFAGLGSFGPNRRYDVPFHPYIIPMILSAVVLLSALSTLFYIKMRTNDRLTVLSLICALLVGFLQVLLLTILVRQQLDVRHLASLAPLVIVLPMALLSEPRPRQLNSFALAAALLVGLVWAVADYRLLALPEYQIENFRAAASRAIALHRQMNADTALIADPAGGAYYGLAVNGPKPCFPLSGDCAVMLHKLPWPQLAPAVNATDWDRRQIRSWLDIHRMRHVPMIVIASEQRHPMYLNSPWEPILRSRQDAVVFRPQGFAVYVLQ